MAESARGCRIAPLVRSHSEPRAPCADAQRACHVTSALDHVDVLILVQALASAWFAASPALHSLAAEDPSSPERLAAHRVAIATAVRAPTGAKPVPE